MKAQRADRAPFAQFVASRKTGYQSGQRLAELVLLEIDDDLAPVLAEGDPILPALHVGFLLALGLALQLDVPVILPHVRLLGAEEEGADVDARRLAVVFDEGAADGDGDEHRRRAAPVGPARERAQRRRAEGALGILRRREVRDAAPLVAPAQPRGQRRAGRVRDDPDAARALVLGAARGLRLRVVAELSDPAGRRRAPHVHARARQRRAEQRRPLVEPRLRRSVARARRVRGRRLHEFGGERARGFERLPLGRVHLHRDDPHAPLRGAAYRGQKGEHEEQDDRRQPDEEVRDNQSAAHAPEQHPLEAHEQLQPVVGEREADDDQREQAERSCRRPCRTAACSARAGARRTAPPPPAPRAASRAAATRAATRTRAPRARPRREVSSPSYPSSCSHGPTII